MGIQKLNKGSHSGFTLIEVLVALAILAFVLSSSLKIFSSNAQVVSVLEQKTMASFVAENILVRTFTSNDELTYANGTETQAGQDYEWERRVLFEEDGKSAQIRVTISSESTNDVYRLTGYKVVR
ncbi:MAG: type II secretion system protein GspI [Gammaproteobacteria bacterium]|nr:MAG: type II secretion system protein GspI [Gammaproteobacteria bacterium]